MHFSWCVFRSVQLNERDFMVLKYGLIWVWHNCIASCSKPVVSNRSPKIAMLFVRRMRYHPSRLAHSVPQVYLCRWAGSQCICNWPSQPDCLWSPPAVRRTRTSGALCRRSTWRLRSTDWMRDWGGKGKSFQERAQLCSQLKAYAHLMVWATAHEVSSQ